MEIIQALEKENNLALLNQSPKNTDTWKKKEAVDTTNKMITHFTAISGSCGHNHSVDSLLVCRCTDTDGFMKIH